MYFDHAPKGLVVVEYLIGHIDPNAIIADQEESNTDSILVFIFIPSLIIRIVPYVAWRFTFGFGEKLWRHLGFSV